MNIPQKSLFSLLSSCQKLLQSVEIWQSYDKKYVCTLFLDTVYFSAMVFHVMLLQTSLKFVYFIFGLDVSAHFLSEKYAFVTHPLSFDLRPAARVRRIS